MLKKAFIAIFVIAIIVSFCGCNKEKSTDIREEKLVQSEDNLDITNAEVSEKNAALMSDKTIEEGIDLVVKEYEKVIDDSFGAEADFSQYYLRLYETEESPLEEISGMVPSDAVSDITPDEKGIRKYAGLFIDRSEGMCFAVLNYDSIDNIKNEFGKYMSEEIYLEPIMNNFCEFEGECYLVRGGRGYGNCTIGEISITEQNSDTIKATAPLLMFNEECGNVNFIFSINTNAESMLYLESAEQIFS